jgi:predicted nucleic acid-binding protein
LARCLDTSFLVDLLRDHPGAVAKGQSLDGSGEALFLPAPVLAEFLDAAYFLGGAHLTRALQLTAGRDVLPVDSEGATLAGRLRADLRKKGTQLPMLDLLIAAVTLQGHHVLVTRDQGFQVLPAFGWVTS